MKEVERWLYLFFWRLLGPALDPIADDFITQDTT